MGERHVMTVRGPVAPESIGPTSMHDHIFWDSSSWWLPESFEDQSLIDVPLTIANSGLARWNALGIRDNLVMLSHEYEAQRGEVAMFAAAGGSCLVDPTCAGLAAQPLLLRQMSVDLDLHIVAGAGLYVEHAHPAWVRSATVGDIHRFITDQVLVGLEGTDVRPGFIGEVGSSNPVTEQEIRVLRAAAQVGASTGTTVAVHLTTPGRHAPMIVDLLTAEGLPADRIVLCHMDEVLDVDYHQSVLDRGATVEFDTFGFEGYFARLWKTPSDGEKMEFLARLVGMGYRNQIVVGHDVALKCQLHRFGGLGYDHLLRRVMPALRTYYGLDDDAVDSLVVANPRRLLTRPGDGQLQNSSTSA